MPTGLGNDSWVNLPTYRDMPLYAMKQSVFSCYMVHLALYVVYIYLSVVERPNYGKKRPAKSLLSRTGHHQ